MLKSKEAHKEREIKNQETNEEIEKDRNGSDTKSQNQPEGNGQDVPAEAEGSSKNTEESPKNTEASLAEEKDRYLRLNAEFQNYKKRVEKEKADLIKYGNEKLLTDLLPVLDHIDRAVSSSENTEDLRLREGISLIKKAFAEVLNANGVTEIEATDRPFHHDEHYAVMTEEVEGKEEGWIIDVLQKGYKLNGRVIRPSMVKVTK